MKVNHIAYVENDRGFSYSTLPDISKAFMEHFRSVYTTSNPIGIEDILQNFNTRILFVFQGESEKDYMANNVKKALFQMDPLKSLGRDGFSISFYQKYWHIVGDQVSTAVINLLDGQGS